MKDAFIAKFPLTFAFKIKEMNIISNNCVYDSICIDLGLDGGIEPYTYNWSNGDTIEDICHLSEGDYSIAVTDANDCLVDSTVNISIPKTLNISIKETDVTVPGGSDGTADLTVSGGVPSNT